VRLTARSSGDDTVKTALKSIQRALAGSLVDIVRVGAMPIENEAKTLAPVKTGTLRRSIHTEVIDSSSTSATARTGTDVVYARRLEFGFVGRDSLGRLYNQAPRPYLRPAFDTKKAQAIADMKAIWRETVQDALENEINQRAAAYRQRHS